MARRPAVRMASPLAQPGTRELPINLGWPQAPQYVEEDT